MYNVGKFLDTEVTNNMSTVFTTLDYDYRHKNKGTGLVLVPRKCGVYKWDQKSYWNKLRYVLYRSSYTQNALLHKTDLLSTVMNLFLVIDSNTLDLASSNIILLPQSIL